ncbi:ovalbumin-related protein X-like [Ornithodoros turicata]|uniref:ovalbumin-related protein X-like n=1 Tax=Ornithodoros turicata TaxID=34597 RepID=UPI003139FDFF
MVLLAFVLVAVASLFGASAEPNEDVVRLAGANNILGIGLLKGIPATGNHVFLSPYSISTAMAMVYNGAGGVTERELANVLGYEASGLRGRVPVLSALLHLLQDRSHQSQGITLEVANAVLTDKTHRLLESYKRDLYDVFQARYGEVDFSKENALVVSQVNQWVSTKTRGKIENFLSELPEDTVLLILNAVYFKGDWANKFQAARTKKLPFYNHGKTATPVDTMSRDGEYLYANDEEMNVNVVELPYRDGDFSMVIFLPHEKDGLRRVLINLTANALDKAMSNLQRREVHLKVPKFKLESKYSLVAALKGLGAKSLFGQSTNLTGISGTERLYVSDVLHDAMVEVNEEGSEAAGATGVVFTLKSSFQPSSVDMHVDHPFLFCIRNRVTKLILFLGVVNKL